MFEKFKTRPHGEDGRMLNMFETCQTGVSWADYFVCVHFSSRKSLSHLTILIILYQNSFAPFGYG